MGAMATIADAADWRVVQMSGKVHVQQGPVRLASLSAGLVLKNGAVVVTEKNGRALLVRGEQTMIVAPNSMVTLPADSGRFTRILEQIGQVEYNVDHRQTRHFSVETPYMAAVVKGTRFKVRVYKGGASVSVLRGRVEVTSLKTGEKVDVLAGQKAVVSKAAGLTVDGTGKIQPIKQGKSFKQGKSLKQGKSARQAQTREAKADSSSVGVGTNSGVSASVGGSTTASVNANAGGKTVSASVGGGTTASVNADAGGNTVSASAGGDTTASVSVNAGGKTVSASVGGGGVSVSVGGLSIGTR
jgi:hypothetical protein